MNGLRQNWIVTGAALLGVVTGGACALAGYDPQAHAVWAVATVVALVPLAVRIVGQLLRREPGVDLIALLALAGALLLDEMLAGAVIGLMLASGQLLEAYAAERARRELTALVARAPRVAHRFGPGGLETVPVDRVEPGDLLLVKEADVVPVDGVVAEGAAVLDESALTGEARPVERAAGDRVESGAVNAGPAFRLHAAARAEESTYAGIVRRVEEAQASRAPVVRLADRYAAAFVPIALVLAGVAWATSGDPVRALAVLVVATPCPLLLAVPIAIVSGISRLARRGVIVKSGGALEALGRVEVVFLDKTGTVTSGSPRLARIATHEGRCEPGELLRLAASVDQVSSHVLAAALVRAAHERDLALEFPTDARESPGVGTVGAVGGRTVRVGRFDWVLEGGAAGDEAAVAFRRRVLRTFGSTVFVAVDGALAGAIVLEDPIRVETPRALRALRRAGVREIVVLTGDHPAVALSVAAALGVDRVLPEQSPAEKVAAVEGARTERGTTVMVGDGINDAPALAAAGVGVAMGARGATASSEAADVVLTTDRFDRLVDAIQAAQRTRRIVIESALVGMGLSAAAMVAAAGGLLPPVIGAALQEVIDLVAIANALRALRPSRGERARAREEGALTPDVAERLQADHQRLGPGLERLRDLADRLDDLPPAEARVALVEIDGFLRTDLLHHERMDEEEIYPEVAARLEGDDPLRALSRTHQEIFHLARLLELLVAELPHGGPEAADLPDIRRLLYGLHALLRLHFGQEEELYQSVSAAR